MNRSLLRSLALAILSTSLAVGCGGGGGGGGGGGVGGPFTPSFSAPIRVDRTGGGTVSLGMDTAEIACDGLNVLVAYSDGVSHTIRANLSSDGGSTWLGTDRLVAVVPAADFVLSLEACRDGHYAYIAWTEYVFAGEFSVHVASSVDDGATWTVRRMNTFSAEYPALACEGSRVYVAWSEGEDAAAFSSRARFNRSVNGGASWQSTDGVVLNPQPFVLGCGAPLNFSIQASGEQVLVSFRQIDTDCSQQNAGDSSVRVCRSIDGGVSFGGGLRLDTTGVGVDTVGPSNQVMAGLGDDVHILWSLFDSSTGVVDFRSSSSSDGGVTWGLDTLVAPNVYDQNFTVSYDLTLCADGTRGHAGYEIRTPGSRGDAHVATSSGGAWIASPRLNSEPLTVAQGPALSCGGGNVYAVFQNLPAGATQMTTRFVWSGDGGATWSPDTTVLASDGSGGAPKVCSDGQHVYALWRNAVTTGGLYLSASHP